ncbi:MAG: hypothetical protein KA974_05675 [Saprospiraceae bacterium]|nr:hypothetical protein [Saprospiraceae bacterium]
MIETKSKNDFTTIQIGNNFSINVFYSINQVLSEWDDLAILHQNKLLSRTFLHCVEAFPPNGITFCYAILYHKNKAVGKIYCQIKHFKAAESLNQEEINAKNAPCFFSTMTNFMKGWVADKVEFITLICGSLLFTGEHGFYFDEKYVPAAEQSAMLERSLSVVQQDLNNRFKKNIAATLIKDFYPTTNTKDLVVRNYNEFQIDPNMVLHIRNWKNFDDYLDAMHSKYRVRVRRAKKKLEGIKKMEFNLEQVQEYGVEIYSLYKRVAQNAGFNLVDLHPNYIPYLASKMSDIFRCFGYFDENNVLIGFYSTIKNGNELEAHFLGFDQALNQEKQIYLNILYDIVELGILENCYSVIFARTAMEIKSSVGAIPYEMNCYLLHQNSFVNRFMKPILDYLRPQEEWLPRHPFK